MVGQHSMGGRREEAEVQHEGAALARQPPHPPQVKPAPAPHAHGKTTQPAHRARPRRRQRTHP